MAKFCTKCGKPLEEGKVCDCSKEETKEKEEVSSSVSANIANDYFEILKGMFAKPLTTIKKYSKDKHFILGLISIAITALIFGLLSHLLANGILKKVGLNLKLVSTAIDAIKMELGPIGASSININTHVGLTAGFVTLALPFVVAGIIWFINSVIFKKNISFKKIIAMIGVCEIFYSVCLLGILIFSLISVGFAAFILLCASLVFFTYLHQGIVEISDVNNDKLIYTITFSIVIPVMAIVSVIVLVYFGNIMISTLGSFTNDITDLIEGLGV